MAAVSFGSCLGPCLEHTGHGVHALIKLLYFKGNTASLAMCIPPTLLYLLKGQLLGLAPEQGHQLSDCQGRCQHLWVGTWKTVRKAEALEGEPRRLPTCLNLTRAYSMIITPRFPIVQATGLIPLEQPSYQCKRVGSQGSCWVQLTGCCSLFLFSSRWCQCWAEERPQSAGSCLPY